MRLITGITGCEKGDGVREIENDAETSVRIVDCADEMIALRIGTQEHSARMTADEARHLAKLLNDAADRTQDRAN